ncbi:hypothetical protein LTR36_007963 [Oleoguttula mirabilis]|uniref:Uncharacterized protein n=1 Tax=Oleoguttula mirabilis TaxID=1507867 RepID=A0AAV9J8X6_9PEZI|nr:hypothetical protein LTR36_007963 [Oleoguttula mirabilis]
MTTTAGLGGLPFLPPVTPTPEPQSTRLLREAEQSKHLEDRIKNQQAHIHLLTTSLDAAATAERKGQERKKVWEEDIAKWMTYAGTLEEDGKAREAELMHQQEEMRGEMCRLEAERKLLREGKAALDTQLAGALTLVATLSGQADKVRSTNEELTAKVNGLEQDAMARRMSAFKMREDLDERQETSGRLHKETEKLAKGLAHAEAEVGQLRSSLAVRETAVDALLAEKHSIAKQLDDAVSLAGTRLQAIEKADGAYKQLQGAKAKLELDIATAIADSAKLRADLLQTVDERDTATRGNTTGAQKVAATAAQINKLHAAAKDLESTIAGLQDDKLRVEKHLVEAEADLNEAQNTQAKLESAAVEGEKMRAKLLAQVEEQSKAMTKLGGQYQQCKQENTELHALQVTNGEALAREVGSVASLQHQIIELGTTIVRLEADVQREKHTAEAATALLVRRHADGARHQEEGEKFLKSITTTPTPKNGPVEGGHFGATHGKPPTTPKLNNQLPSPKTPPNKTSSPDKRRPAVPTPKESAVTQGSAELPCFGAPLPLPQDPRSRSGLGQHAGTKRPGEHDTARERKRAPPGKRPCLGNR